MKLSLRIGISASVATAVVLLMTRSIVIASAFGALAAGIAFVTVRTKNTLNEAALIAAWPEVIDHLMSGIQSGLSLSESLAGLRTLHIFQLQLPGFFCCSYQLNQVQLWLIRLHLVH